jgi:hypothetical protein
MAEKGYVNMDITIEWVTSSTETENKLTNVKSTGLLVGILPSLLSILEVSCG